MGKMLYVVTERGTVALGCQRPDGLWEVEGWDHISKSVIPYTGTVYKTLRSTSFASKGDLFTGDYKPYHGVIGADVKTMADRYPEYWEKFEVFDGVRTLETKQLWLAGKDGKVYPGERLREDTYCVDLTKHSRYIGEKYQPFTGTMWAVKPEYEEIYGWAQKGEFYSDNYKVGRREVGSICRESEEYWHRFEVVNGVVKEVEWVDPSAEKIAPFVAALSGDGPLDVAGVPVGPEKIVGSCGNVIELINSKRQFGQLGKEALDNLNKGVKGYDHINPDHYKQNSFEVIEMMEMIWGPEKVAVYCEINAFKYRLRLGNKPDQPVERELEKARWYEKKRKELLQRAPSTDKQQDNKD